jgi:hypothetical protein
LAGFGRQLNFCAISGKIYLSGFLTICKTAAALVREFPNPGKANLAAGWKSNQEIVVSCYHNNRVRVRSTEGLRVLFPSGFPSSKRFVGGYLVIAPEMTATPGNGIVHFGGSRDLTSGEAR